MTQLHIPHEQVEDSNTSTNPHFDALLQARLSRRSVLGGGVGMTAAMMFGGAALTGCVGSSDDDSEAPAPVTPDAPKSLTFTPVAKNKLDVVTVPADYEVSVLYALGDPIINSVDVPAWKDDGMQSGASFEFRSGDCHDGMHYFGLTDAGKFTATRSDRGLLCVNHEYVIPTFLHPNGATTDADGKRPADEVRREVNAHGIGVIEVKRDENSNKMTLVKSSRFNRRVTSMTTCDLTGPAAGKDIMITKFSTNGLLTRGINNNCGNGYTPWGTYLTCEENFNGVFSRVAGDDAKRTTQDVNALNRYGLKDGATSRFKWSTAAETTTGLDEFTRWNNSVTADSAAQDFRNAMNTFGWIVEIDPFQPTSKPVKRTALGRFAHEGCWPAPVVVGQPVVFYMGDDARGEYLYKFVSKALWSAADINGGLAAGAKYMDEGTLYVAKFAADGTGSWVELTHGKNDLNEANPKYAFRNQGDVVTFARLAADSVGATKMDRPEWTAVSPLTGEVYLTLTNNSNRGTDYPVDAANPRNYTDVYTNSDNTTKTNKGNVNGHIIRWKEQGGLHNAANFQWDVYLFGAEADAGTAINLSGLTNVNDFSSPDGLWFDPRGVLWIQTDDGAYTDETNCMMLAALPDKVGNGGKKTVGSVDTFMGKTPTQATLSRFLVGPKDCEVTGIAMTPDCKTLFVNIQHPGEDGTLAAMTSHWPASQTNASATSRPRSGTVVITRKDGGVILG